MKQLKFEYVWLDGYLPEPCFRSKTKILPLDDYKGELDALPVWSFDGSSTHQAEGSSSDCLLQPVRVYKDHDREDGYLVLCEVLNADGTPHISNTRSLFEDDEDLWLGFEQEYVLSEDGKPCGFPEHGFPAPQGKYYCGVGTGKVTGRQLVEDHLSQSLKNGIAITGVNAEVMIGQWEFQVFGKGAKKAADDLLMARYLLERTSEKYDCVVDFHPKPVEGDWNGSGLHTNFSTALMRNVGGEELMKTICDAFAHRHAEHIAAYTISDLPVCTRRRILKSSALASATVGLLSEYLFQYLPTTGRATWKTGGQLPMPTRTRWQQRSLKHLIV